MPGTPHDSGDEMHTEVAWMKPSDRPIVKEIADYGGWMKPATLALNAPYTRNHIASRCRVLSDHDLLERHEDTAAYRISDLGEQFLLDALEPADLEASELEDAVDSTE